MKYKNTTLMDIAKVANVSMMTVSRAIHGKVGVSMELKKKIFSIAEEMNYVPHRASCDFGLGKLSMTIGVVVPHISNTIFPEILQNIESVLSSNGYRIMLCCSYNNPVKEFHEISSLLERTVDGIIWCPVLYEENYHLAKNILKQKCPLVFLDRIIKDIDVDSVTVDDQVGMYNIVNHLLSQGIKRIAYLGAITNSYVAIERLNGYKKALQEANINIDEELILNCGSDIESGSSAMRYLLKTRSDIEAVCCFNDPLAVGAAMEILEQELKIPDNIAVTGFSNTIESQIFKIPISTVAQDAQGLGQAASNLLLSHMLNSSVKRFPIKKIIKTKLIVRESSTK